MTFLKNPNNLTFFITPPTIEKVNDPISDLKAGKSTGPSSLPTKIMKQLNDIIASPLAELINKSFQRSSQSSKVSQEYSAITIDQYLRFQTLRN